MSNYKVLVLTNKLPFTLNDDVQKVIEYFKTRLPFPIEFSYREVDLTVTIKPYKVFKGFDIRTGQPSMQIYYGLADNVKDSCRNHVKENEYDVVIFAWNIDSIPQPKDGAITSFTNYLPLYQKTGYIQLAINQYLKNQGNLWIHIAHELCHEFCYNLQRKGIKVVDEMDETILPSGQRIAFYKNDTPEAVDGNFANTLENIRPYFIKPITQYKYFSQLEIDKWQLSSLLWAKLDESREYAGIPFRITSGLRRLLQNESVGGSPTSTHLNGTGCDISCTDSVSRYKIVTALLKAGFTRIGVYASHIHCDLNKEGVMWLSDKD